MIDRNALTQVVEQAIAGTDLFVVRIAVSRDNVVEVDLDSMTSVTIDQCVMVNNAVLEAFDRDIEDYELTVGSYGISSPLLVRRQYDKNLGREVEVLTRDGRKLKGTLTEATDAGFTIKVPTKVKPEGKKRPELVMVAQTLAYDAVKHTKSVISI